MKLSKIQKIGISVGSVGLIAIVLQLSAKTSTASVDQLETTNDPSVFEVIGRKRNGKAERQQVALDGLSNPRFAETRDFRIVEKKENEALEWSTLSDDDRLRAANLLHHLTRAKQEFMSRFNSTEVKGLEQILIRINITNRWSNLGHFENDNKDPQFNNAHTLPGGQGLAGHAIEPWNREIWFRPMKEIPIQEVLNHLASDPLDSTIAEAREIFYPAQLNTGVQTVVRGLVSNPIFGSSFLSSMTRQGGTILVAEGAFVLLKELNRAMLPKSYYLDTAMVPEIIYHEFSHVALSDYLAPTHATPVVEGMADYFASVIADSPKLATKIKEFSKGMGKNGSKKKTFNVDYESNRLATSDFVLGMLWGVRNVLGADVTDRLIWDSRKHLNTFESDIRTGLIGAILTSCKTVCQQPSNDRLKLLQYFETLGI